MSVSNSLKKARTLNRKGKTADAISLYREVLDRFPKNREAMRELRALSVAPEPGSASAAAAIAEFRKLNSNGSANWSVMKPKDISLGSQWMRNQ